MKVAYCWYSSDNYGPYIRDGVQVSGPKMLWSGGDTFQFELDCDRHTLQVTHLGSQVSRRFTDLPDKEYFVFAGLYSKGNSVMFVE